MLENYEGRLLLNYFISNINKISSNEYEIKISGNSMLPTIKNGDIVKICSHNDGKIKMGDIVCYDNNSYFVLHRVVGLKRIGSQIKYVVKGDNMPRPDINLVGEEQILGICKQDASPLMYILYSCGKFACIISSLSFIKSFIQSIMPKHMVVMDYPPDQTNIKINIMIIQNSEGYCVEVFSDNYREKYMHKTIEEVKGNIYSILFHANWLKNEYSGCITLHAGGVKIGNQLVLVLGESGSGKSSLIYCLARRGYAYFSDEKIYMQLKNNKLEAIPFYTPIMLRRDIASINNILEKTYVNNDMTLEEKYIVGVTNLVEEQQNATGIIVIPKWRREVDFFSGNKVSSVDAFSMITQNLLAGDDVKKIGIILHILKEFDVYDIQYSRSEVCADAIEHLLKERGKA